MNAPISRTLFVRPMNMMITQPLQVLSIARELSKRSGNRLTRFRVVREPDQQRLLNFGSFAFQDSKTASEIINTNQSSEIQVPMNSRAASNYENLVFATEKKQDREIGLIEVASMVGLPLNITGRQTIRQKIEDDVEGNQDVSQTESDSEIKYVLAPISELKDDAVFYATVKCERRQAETENIRSGKGLFQNARGFDLNSNAELKLEPIIGRGLSRLDSSWEIFKGFSNRRRM